MTNERPFYLEERQQAILDLLDSSASVRIADLSERFGVSEATIRKDMRALEREGRLRRTHGGAIKPNRNATEMPFETAAVTAREEKTRIGRAAAELVSDGDTFLLQSGTTCQQFLNALKGRKRLTIITNDLSHALKAEKILEDSEIILLGGSMRCGYHYTQCAETIRQLGNYCAPTAFMCANAFSFSKGFTAHRLEQANMVQALLDASERHIMLMDSSKIGVAGTVRAAELSSFNCLITDTGVDMDTRQRFAEEAPGLHVVYA